MLELLSVLLGGALGGMARLALGNAVGRRLGAHLPWGTLAVNLSGALAMGMLAGVLGLPAPGVSNTAWSLLAIGLLGGYTTVSSLSLQTLALWQQGRETAAISYMAMTLVAGLAALALGAWLTGGLA
ncbi:fluoride efflux transporter CrcB [Halomonas sp. G15]|uniref:fluoride efflux transporter CrcB n=1 Tax=Halomonas sp. G15 TaxID=2903521 RepID=UPI001E32371B|nr:fluoride efflux transporter CrcB [Halomonas sp. G15]MCE0732726.1 fluoride efflux transporter CrcB [Halomonas sp. G15]